MVMAEAVYPPIFPSANGSILSKFLQMWKVSMGKNSLISYLNFFLLAPPFGRKPVSLFFFYFTELFQILIFVPISSFLISKDSYIFV